MKLVLATLVFALIAVSGGAARAECNCLAVAGDVSAAVQAQVANADGLYVRGDFDGALGLYADAYADAQDSVLLYAQAMCQWQLGAMDDAEAMFTAYIEAGGDYAARAKKQLEDVRAGVAAGGVGGVVGGAVGGVVGGVGGLVGGVTGGVEGGVEGGVGVVGGVTGRAKPKKVAKGAAILLGVVAVVAVVAIAVQGIGAGLNDDIDPDTGLDAKRFDKGFALGAGLGAVVMGGTAFYLYGLTTAVGAAGGACSAISAKDNPAPTFGLGAGVKF